MDNISTLGEKTVSKPIYHPKINVIKMECVDMFSISIKAQ